MVWRNQRETIPSTAGSGLGGHRSPARPGIGNGSAYASRRSQEHLEFLSDRGYDYLRIAVELCK